MPKPKGYQPKPHELEQLRKQSKNGAAGAKKRWENPELKAQMASKVGAAKKAYWDSLTLEEKTAKAKKRMSSKESREKISKNRKKWHQDHPDWGVQHMKGMHQLYPNLWESGQAALKELQKDPEYRKEMAKKTTRHFPDSVVFPSWGKVGYAKCGHWCRRLLEISVHNFLADCEHEGERMIPNSPRYCDLVLSGQMIELDGMRRE